MKGKGKTKMNDYEKEQPLLTMALIMACFVLLCFAELILHGWLLTINTIALCVTLIVVIVKYMD